MPKSFQRPNFTNKQKGVPMLIYEYKCKKCTHSFKKPFFIVDDAPFVCPKCGDRQVKELLNYISLIVDRGIGIHSTGKPKGLL